MWWCRNSTTKRRNDALFPAFTGGDFFIVKRDDFWYNVLDIGKTSYVKRVIGLPGDHVTIRNGKVYINNEELKEDYLQSNVVTEVTGYFCDITVPEKTVFAMGDNRAVSMDCRAFGCIPLEKIESKVALRFWPFNKFGTVK